MVEIWVIVYGPYSSCPIDFAFNVTLVKIVDSSLDNGSAGNIKHFSHTEKLYLHSSFTASYLDNSVVGKCIFLPCVTRSCVNVAIVNESFNITLKKDPDLDSKITLDPLVGLVKIKENEG